MREPDGYAFRAPAAADADAVGALFAAERAHDPEAPLLDANFIRRVWSLPGFDAASGAWVAIDGSGTIVAYAQVSVDEPGVIGSWGIVHPARRGRGIGIALLDRIERRAAELADGDPATAFRHAVSANDHVAAAMVRARGLHPIRHFWHMQADLDAAMQAPPAPAGIDLGGVDGDEDLRAVHAILVDAFVGDPGDHPRPFDEWIQDETSGGYDPTLWLLAREDGTPVGALTASAGDEDGSVDWLGVRTSHRGRGIGTAMLLRAFATFASRGLTGAMVNVDAENVTGATAVYERVGMRPVGRWDMWERPGVSGA
jgi:mycothiol synthase